MGFHDHDSGARSQLGSLQPEAGTDLHHRENPPPKIHDAADVRRGLRDPGDFRNPHDLAGPRDGNPEFLTVQAEDDQMTLGFRFLRPNGAALLGHVVGKGQQAVPRGEF